MSLTIYFSDRIEDLADGLKAKLVEERRSADPFRFSTVVVPNTNIAKWLRVRTFADEPSLCMGIDFPFIEGHLFDLLSRCLASKDRPKPHQDGDYPVGILSILLGDPDPLLAPFRRYVADGDAGPLSIDSREKARMAWQLSSKLAGLMDQYEVYRPEIVGNWFRNLSQNAFSTVSARPDGRTRVEPFLCGRKAGARPDRKCRFGFSWEDVEAVAGEYAAGQCPQVSWRRLEARKARKTHNRLEDEPVPPPEEIRLLLADAPEKAIDAIGRMEYLPESLERPFGPRERLVSDAICDRSLPKGTRVRLLCSVGNDRTFDGLPPVEARDVPLGFLDSSAGCFSTSARTGMANMRPPVWKRPRRSSLESSGRASTPWAATCSGTRSTTRATERPKRRSSATAAIPTPKPSGA